MPEQMKIKSMTWEYVRNVIDENGEKKKLRTKVKMNQLRSTRKLTKDELIKDRSDFKEKIYEHCGVILQDLFPEESLEARLGALDLLEIMKDDKVVKAEADVIEEIGKSLFLGKQVTLPSGQIVQFRAEYGDVLEAKSEWVREGKSIARDFAGRLMQANEYKDTRSVVVEEMKAQELLKKKDLDELKALWNDDYSGSTVNFLIKL